MRSLALTIVIILAFSSCDKKQDVTKQVSEIFSKTEGNFALAFRDLQTGEEILINEHRMFHAASTMKTPVMIEVYKQAAAGRFSLSDSLTVKTEFNSIVESTFSLSPSDDSEQELYAIAGKKHPISDLVYKMIILSSNLATNILIELVDAKEVTQSMRDLGANEIQVLRGVEDGKAFRAGLNNKVSAYDLMTVFSAIANGKVAGSDDMVRILLDQKFNDMIPAQLPKEVKVAHKTGSITGLHHDSALVILPDGRKYVLILLSDELKNEDEGVKTMATASKLIYDHVTR
jgi:beta-lactamase class A